MTEERWLPVPGWEGFYEVSDLGRVRSLPRAGTPRNRVLILRQYPKTHGYLNVVLVHGARRVTTTVHRLVLEAFAGVRPAGMQACHGLAGRQDNRLANLRWDTHEANVRDRVLHGSHRGERNPRCKLSDQDVARIRALLGAGHNGADLARMYGVSRTHIYRIRDGLNRVPA